MNAVREIVTPVSNKIIVNLPGDFQKEKRYEVIILPIEENTIKKSRKELFGKYKGNIQISNDFNAPIDDLKDYME